MVGILALLAAFVVPNLMRSGEQAKIDIAKASVGRSGDISMQLKKYKFDVGKYPDTDEGLEALHRIPSSIDEDDKIWKGPYLETPPEELRDPWNQEFVYESPGKFNEDGFDLSSKGPDQKEGTEDDIKNWTDK
ncbi:MAG: type II secretion system protein GspG [Phycisphaerae bacterium]|nr:MAG: type II secretion system protein GspG [Phycisphaerae bacterium]